MILRVRCVGEQDSTGADKDASVMYDTRRVTARPHGCDVIVVTGDYTSHMLSYP